MLSQSSLQFLEQFLSTDGPSGFEFESAACYRRYAETFAEKVTFDVLGNTIASLNPEAPFKVMIAGHCDEIGFQVTYISDEGFVFFRPVGGVDRNTVPGTEVKILTEKGPLYGVIGRKAIHMQSQKERDTPSEFKDLWIDTGIEDGAKVKELVTVGDAVSCRSNFRRLGENRILSKSLDDKIGAFVAVEVLKTLAARKLPVGVFAVATTQEEVGTRGVKPVSYGIDAQAGFCVDVGHTTDIPGTEKKVHGDVKLGGGPILTRNADNNPVLVRRMMEQAKARSFPFQLVCGGKPTGGTDTASMQLARSGVATALVSIPNRYMHTPVELCDLRDVENAIGIIAETIGSFTGNETFIPGIDGR